MVTARRNQPRHSVCRRTPPSLFSWPATASPGSRTRLYQPATAAMMGSLFAFITATPPLMACNNARGRGGTPAAWPPGSARSLFRHHHLGCSGESPQATWEKMKLIVTHYQCVIVRLWYFSPHRHGNGVALSFPVVAPLFGPCGYEPARICFLAGARMTMTHHKVANGTCDQLEEDFGKRA